MVQDAPLVSVIIVNHNGIDFVDTCLRSVLSSQYKNFEIIFVDNASTDGSLEYVKKTFGNDSKLRFVENSSSVGPAVGRNRGARVSGGKYLIFLDNDTEVDKSWITELVRVFETDPNIGAAQSKLLRTEPRNVFDYAGDYLTPFGFLSERARSAQDEGQFDYICEIFSAKSAASAIRKDVLDKIGGFDEDFYMYLEETDLCWIVWLSGYRVVFIPRSVVYHAYGTKKKQKIRYYPEYVVRYLGCRNYISTLIKNLGDTSLIKILPLQIASWLLLSVMYLFKLKLRDAFWMLKAVGWNLTSIALLKKRFFIQRNIRKVKDSQIMSKIMISRPLNYYFKKAVSYIYARPY